ncbi:MAG: hypothetical protein QW292_11530 [Candidatus Parvarchaeota archaeon]
MNPGVAFVRIGEVHNAILTQKENVKTDSLYQPTKAVKEAIADLAFS